MTNGTYTSDKRKPNTSGLGEYSDRDLLQELMARETLFDIIGETPEISPDATLRDMNRLIGESMVRQEIYKRIQTILKGGE